jgi:hypothetical protein
MAIIQTTHGDLDEALLTRREGQDEDDNACATWVEYRLGEEIVRRDVHITMKRGLFSAAVAADL